MNILTLCLLACTSVCSSFSLPTPTAGATSSSSSALRSTSEATTDTSSATPWKDIEAGPPDAILGIAQAFRSCTDPRKVNVCVGAYRDSDGQPWVLPSVRTAEVQLADATAQGTANKEYLPIEGDAAFIAKALAFAYGNDDADLLARVAGIQSLSGTGACRVGGHFVARFLPGRALYIPTPTWGNHWKIFGECGLDTRAYRYYDRARNGLDWEGLVEDLEAAPNGSVVLLHACAHNPTGCDPTLDQWHELGDLLERKEHVAFFDSAYQGFASGDAEHDAAALRYMVQSKKVPVLLAQSFAKNFGLYGERCGTLSVVCDSVEQKDRVLSQLKCIIRPMYSSPPRHGSSLVKTVLSDDALTAQYYEECAGMAARIQAMRSRLVDALAEAGSTLDWSHITQQIGMFAYTGMTSEMCERLTDEYAIFLTKDGRISMAGLNDNNLEYVAQAIHVVTQADNAAGSP